MTRRRWIADEVHGSRAFLKDSHADHLVRVLRVRVGQQFEISTGNQVFQGTVAAIHDHAVEFALGEEVPCAALPLSITLALAIFKFDRMEWVIEKGTELGVSRIIPVIARRTDSHLAVASARRVERWQRIALQAAQQCRRAVPPTIEAPMKVELATTLSASARILLAETEKALSLRDALEELPSGTDLMFAIGPEGGWTEEELLSFRDRGWMAVTLGQTILRAETAAIAALALAAAFLA
jgi:16S rRNA (uracil1498-N3)-methyltransferase